MRACHAGVVHRSIMKYDSTAGGARCSGKRAPSLPSIAVGNGSFGMSGALAKDAQSTKPSRRFRCNAARRTPTGPEKDSAISRNSPRAGSADAAMWVKAS